MNRNHPSILDPVSRIAVFVNLLRGPDVDDWGRQALERTNDRIVVQGMAHNDEQLWQLLIGEFHAQFRDPALRENAQAKMGKLRMVSDIAVDDYIAKFNVLASELRWQRQTEGAVDAFKGGLKNWLVNKILDRDHYPDDHDLDGWQAAARVEATRNMKKRQSGGRFAKGNLTVRENLVNEFLAQRKGNARRNIKEKDPDAMDVDTAEVTSIRKKKTSFNPSRFNNLSNEERKKLSAEGRCFICKKQGHMARACPDKIKKGKPNPSFKNARKHGLQNQEVEMKTPVLTKKAETMAMTAIPQNLRKVKRI